MYAFQGTVKSNAVGCGQGREAINIALVAEQRKRWLVSPHKNQNWVHFPCQPLRKDAQIDASMFFYVALCFMY